MRARGSSRGFTLVELLAVIGVLSVLMGIGLGFLGKIRPGDAGVPSVVRARLAAARATARALGTPAWVEFKDALDQRDERLHLELATMVNLVSFSFEQGERGAYGQVGALGGGKIVAEGRFGNGLVHEGPGKPGLVLETDRMAHLSLEFGFTARADVRPSQRGAMIVFRWGSSFTLGLDAAGRPQASLTLQGRPGLPGERRELTGQKPVALGRWTTLELTHDGSRALLKAGGWLEAVADFPGRPFYKRDVPLVISDAQYPVAGVVDEVRLFTVDFEPAEALPEGFTILEGPRVVRFAPGGELDPEFHAGPVRLRLGLPGDRVRTLMVSVLGVVQ